MGIWGHYWSITGSVFALSFCKAVSEGLCGKIPLMTGRHIDKSPSYGLILKRFVLVHAA